MSDELNEYAQSVDARFALLLETISAMTAEQLNRRPPVEGANSAWVLAVHIAGNARAWIRGIAAGQDLTRDRPAEFASGGDDASRLIVEIEREREQVMAALTGLSRERLEARVVPSKELWGENDPREISVRRAILQVIEHASLHIGHIELTRDWLRSAR